VEGRRRGEKGRGRERGGLLKIDRQNISFVVGVTREGRNLSSRCQDLSFSLEWSNLISLSLG
jgi:hypothetical protein